MYLVMLIVRANKWSNNYSYVVRSTMIDLSLLEIYLKSNQLSDDEKIK